MKSMMIAMSIFAAAPAAMAFQVEPYEGADNSAYISWCERNNVMIVVKDQIVTLSECGSALTCTAIRNWVGYRYEWTASCMATKAPGTQPAQN